MISHFSVFVKYFFWIGGIFLALGSKEVKRNHDNRISRNGDNAHAEDCKDNGHLKAFLVFGISFPFVSICYHKMRCLSSQKSGIKTDVFCAS